MCSTKKAAGGRLITQTRRDADAGVSRPPHLPVRGDASASTAATAGTRRRRRRGRRGRDADASRAPHRPGRAGTRLVAAPPVDPHEACKRVGACPSLSADCDGTGKRPRRGDTVPDAAGPPGRRSAHRRPSAVLPARRSVRANSGGRCSVNARSTRRRGGRQQGA